MLKKLRTWIKGGNKMKVSKAMIESLILIEGSKSRIYADSAGKDTIGVGHLIGLIDDQNLFLATGKTPGTLTKDHVLTDAEIFYLLQLDLEIFEKAVKDCVHEEMSQNQFDAFVCFAYNVGISGFKKSTVLKEFLAGNLKEAAESFLLWSHYTNPVTGKLTKSYGLFNRRVFEKNVFLFPEVDLQPEEFTRKSDLGVVMGWLAMYRKNFRNEG